jgi:hypothetical protein
LLRCEALLDNSHLPQECAWHGADEVTISSKT